MTDVTTKVSPLVLVDCALEPEMVYSILDAMYDNEVNKPDENWSVITYLEDRLLDLDLPLAREEWETKITSHPENEQYKRLVYWQQAEKEDN